MSKGLRLFWSMALGAPMALLASVAWAQTTLPGNSTTGEALWNANGCSGCHTLTKARADITARAPAGMSFDKALAALNAALSGTDLDNNATGMQGFAPSLNATNRNDIAAYIAGLAGPAPIISYTPTGGAMFTATAVGASSNATVTIRNTGTAPLTFATNNAVTIATGGDATDFRIASATCNPGSTLAANSGSCTITATFTPAAGASLTRTASIGIATTTSVSLVPMQGSVSVPAAAAPPTGSANSPSSGGGGALSWPGVILALAGLAFVRRPPGRAMRFQHATAAVATFLAVVLFALPTESSAQATRGRDLWWNAAAVKARPSLPACASCHTDPATGLPLKVSRTAANIQTAIDANLGGMKDIFVPANNAILNGTDLSDLQLYLAAVGATPAARAKISTQALGFPSTAVGVDSTPLTVTVSHDVGSAATFTLAAANALTITGGNASDFRIAGGTCADGLAVPTASSCTIQVIFRPTAVGSARAATLNMAFAETHVPAIAMPLVGAAVAAPVPTISLSRTSVVFPNTLVSTSSAAETITLTNAGTLAINIASLTTTGANATEFARGGTCANAGTVAPAASCTITYTFTPGDLGARAGSLVIASNNATGDVTVPLSGSGAGNTPVFVSTPASLTFSAATGTTSPAQNVTVRNDAGGTLTVTNVATTGPYAATANNCAALSINQTCTIAVTFTPTVLGAANGTLTINHNAGTAGTVVLNGTGVVAIPLVVASTASYTFQNLVLVNQLSQTVQRIRFTNNGPGPAVLASATSSAEFPTTTNGITAPCSANRTIAQGSFCEVDVRFQPSAAGVRNGTLAFVSNGSPGTLSVSLAGTGSGTAAPILRYATGGTAMLGPVFPVTKAGETAQAIRVTLTNVGTTAMTFPASGVATISGGFDPGDFKVASATCAASAPLQPNTGNCTVDVTFAPAAAGANTRSAILMITSSVGSDQIPLYGVVEGATGAAPAAPPPSSASPAPSTPITSSPAPAAAAGDGGGGSLNSLWVGLVLLVTTARRRSALRP
jgi:cytochrome c553